MRAVMVFCEGNHDVAFVTRSLGALAGAHWVDRPIGKLPAPLGTKPNPKNPKQAASRSVIAMRYESRPIDDLKLSGAAHAPVPTFDRVVEVSVDRTLYVMMRCGGDRAARPVLELLEDMRAVMTVASDLDALALAFMFDADGAGLGARELAFSRDYAACVDSEHGEPLRHGQWGRGRHGPVGLFVFHDPDTLRSPADRQKAQIGVTGQFKFPGGPLTQVLDRNEGLSRERFMGPVSRALVEFLRGVPW